MLIHDLNGDKAENQHLLITLEVIDLVYVPVFRFCVRLMIRLNRDFEIFNLSKNKYFKIHVIRTESLSQPLL